MSGKDVKRQGLQGLRWATAHARTMGHKDANALNDAADALAPCVVLTPEEAKAVDTWLPVTVPSHIRDYLLSPDKREPGYVTHEDQAVPSNIPDAPFMGGADPFTAPDVGPPAPGEGEPEDGYPNPEVGMKC